MAAVLFDGPLVSLYAVGTVTHAIDAGQMVAFGHPLFWDGQPAFPMPVTPARVVQFVNAPVFGNFKLANTRHGRGGPRSGANLDSSARLDGRTEYDHRD
jgi:hypothetical protein